MFDAREYIHVHRLGNLHFANVLASDALEQTDHVYLCGVFNDVIRRASQGSDQRVRPVKGPGTSARPRRGFGPLAAAAAAWMQCINYV